MNEDEFEDLVDRHGGEASRWPPARREAAAALLGRSAAARALLAEATAVESWLRAGPGAAADDPLAARRMAARASRGPQRRAWLLRPAGLGPVGAGLAAALVLAAGLATGLATGFATGPHRAGAADGGVEEAPSQLVAAALEPRGGEGGAPGEAASDVD